MADFKVSQAVQIQRCYYEDLLVSLRHGQGVIDDRRERDSPSEFVHEDIVLVENSEGSVNDVTECEQKTEGGERALRR